MRVPRPHWEASWASCASGFCRCGRGWRFWPICDALSVEGSGCVWPNTTLFLRSYWDTSQAFVPLLRWCEGSEKLCWDRSGLLPLMWLFKAWNLEKPFSRLSVGDSLRWKKLGFKKTFGWVVETWSESWLCHVLTFQTLGLSINVFGSSVSIPGKWEVITIIPICISWVKVFHIHTKSYDMTLMGKWWVFVAASWSRDQNLPHDSRVQQTVPSWLCW